MFPVGSLSAWLIGVLGVGRGWFASCTGGVVGNRGGLASRLGEKETNIPRGLHGGNGIHAGGCVNAQTRVRC